MLYRRLCLPFLCNRHSMEVTNIDTIHKKNLAGWLGRYQCRAFRWSYM